MAPKKPAIPDGVSLTKQRAYLSEITVSLGLFNVPCAFVPAKATDNSLKLKVVCPHTDHGKDAIAPTQQYVCDGNDAVTLVRKALNDPNITKIGNLRDAIDAALLAVHGPYASSEAARAREVDGVLHKLSPEEVETFRKTADDTDIIEQQMALQASPREQVAANILPSGTVYRLRPKSGAFVAYSILMDAIAETEADTVVYGEVIARDQQKLFALSVFTDAEGTRQIIAQEMLRPGDLAELDHATVEYPDSHLKMAVDLIHQSTEDFDPEMYENRRKAKAEELDEQLRSGGGGTAISTVAARSSNGANGSDALLAALEASLSATTKAS